jgi:hypothetical protein
LKKTDNLIKKAEDLVKATTSAREQIGKTLDTYNAIFADDTKDVKKVYKSVEGEMKKTEERREDVKKQLDEMKVEADVYFASWKASLAQIGIKTCQSETHGKRAASSTASSMPSARPGKPTSPS